MAGFGPGVATDDDRARRVEGCRDLHQLLGEIGEAHLRADDLRDGVEATHTHEHRLATNKHTHSEADPPLPLALRLPLQDRRQTNTRTQ